MVARTANSQPTMSTTKAIETPTRMPTGTERVARIPITAPSTPMKRNSVVNMIIDVRRFWAISSTWVCVDALLTDPHRRAETALCLTCARIADVGSPVVAVGLPRVCGTGKWPRTFISRTHGNDEAKRIQHSGRRKVT